MENNSIFNKLNLAKEEKAESKEVSKERVNQEVLLEIEELKQKKQEYLDLYQKITSEKAELSTNHEEYKKALEVALAVFENEEVKALLAEQGVDGVQGLLREHPDTDEAKNFATAELSVKESLAKLKELKAEIIEKLDIENPHYKTLKRVAPPLQWAADRIDGEIFQKQADTIEGRLSWPVSYPTGIYYKEGEFEKNIRENKEPKLRELYHELGDKIDAAFLEAANEYQAMEGSEKLGERSSKEGRHIFNRSPISVGVKEVQFYFGGGYSDLKYEIKQNDQGKLSFSRVDDFKAILPEELIRIFNKKLRQIDEEFRSTIESI